MKITNKLQLYPSAISQWSRSENNVKLSSSMIRDKKIFHTQGHMDISTHVAWIFSISNAGCYKKPGKHVRFCFANYTTYKVKSNVINDEQFFTTDFHESPLDNKLLILHHLVLTTSNSSIAETSKLCFFICTTFTCWKFPYAILFSLIYLFFVVVRCLTHEWNLFENNFMRWIVLFYLVFDFYFPRWAIKLLKYFFSIKSLKTTIRFFTVS